MTKRLVWIFPDRDSTTRDQKNRRDFWDEYRSAAEGCGMTLDVVSPEVVDARHDGTATEVTVNGLPVAPGDTIFITEVYTFPHQQPDLLNQVMLYGLLKTFGFYLPIPLELSIVANDKLATAALFSDDCFRIAPSCRVTPGRDLGERDWRRNLKGLDPPVVVKPANWGGGIGVAMVHDVQTLESVLDLAKGSESPMIVQRRIGSTSDTIDYRVYCVGGVAHTVLTRRPVGEALVANATLGGSTDFVELPEQLRAPVKRAVELLDLPFFCIDFLYDGDEFWFSEIELDGAITTAVMAERHHNQVRDLLSARLTAYSDAHDRFLAAERSTAAGLTDRTAR